MNKRFNSILNDKDHNLCNLLPAKVTPKYNPRKDHLFNNPKYRTNRLSDTFIISSLINLWIVYVLKLYVSIVRLIYKMYNNFLISCKNALYANHVIQPYGSNMISWNGLSIYLSTSDYLRDRGWNLCPCKGINSFLCDQPTNSRKRQWRDRVNLLLCFTSFETMTALFILQKLQVSKLSFHLFKWKSLFAIWFFLPPVFNGLDVNVVSCDSGQSAIFVDLR